MRLITAAETAELLGQIGGMVRGRLLTDEASRRSASVDGSIFEQLPAAVLEPRDAADLQAVLHLLHRRALAGLPLLAVAPRGAGSDQAGGPLTAGIALSLRPGFDQVLEVGPDFVRVEPGVRYGELQDELRRNGRYLPPYPASLEICTIGGAVANNSSGEKTVKYGDTRDWLEEVDVVLADGSLATFGRIPEAEARARSARRTFEGHVYREVLRILDAHGPDDGRPRFHVTKNATGYAVGSVRKRGHVDMAALICGSQGTLGIVTAITLRTAPVPVATSLTAGYFAKLEPVASAVQELLALRPSALEIVDKNLLQLVDERRPGSLKGLLPRKLPEIVLVIEFDDAAEADRTGKAAAARTILEKYAAAFREAATEDEQAQIWKLRRSAAAIIWTVPTPAKALPIVEDGIVPAALLPEFFRRAYRLFAEYGFRCAVWGHAGDANLHMQPFIDLADPAQRVKIRPFVDAFHEMVIGMGGCISAEHNDGYLRTPYLEAQYGATLLGIFKEIKAVFDPHGYLNPGKKIGSTWASIEPLMRTEYGLGHLVTDHAQIDR